MCAYSSVIISVVQRDGGVVAVLSCVYSTRFNDADNWHGSCSHVWYEGRLAPHMRIQTRSASPLVHKMVLDNRFTPTTVTVAPRRSF